MKLEKEHIENIKNSFANMQSKTDLLYLLNEVKPLIYGDKSIPFEMKQLNWYANPSINIKRYIEFNIQKKSGELRTIHAPVAGLKAIQKTLNLILQCIYEPNAVSFGFINGRSVVDNAKLHVGNRYVYNIDLKNFFPSIDQARVWKSFQLAPFNLNNDSKQEVKIIVWKEFKKEYLGLDELDKIKFYQGNGRIFSLLTFSESADLKNGTLGEIYHEEMGSLRHSKLYLSKTLDYEKEKFVIVANKNVKSNKNKSLDGTLWMVNKIPSFDKIKLASLIANLCCTELIVKRLDENGQENEIAKNVLPQGAPTSPIISNIICQKLDHRLTGVAKRFGLKYSRYADDITFSSMHNVYQPESEFLKEIHRIISEQNFRIKESKTRLQKDGYRKEVTGLLVNEKVNVRQRYIKQLRVWLYYWENYGYERASGFFLQQYITDKGHVKNGKPDMANVIAGKLDYLKMVKGADNELYLKLKMKFNKLIGYVDPINQLLSVWKSEGIDQAMEIFYKDKLK